jgi:putative tryptophan/tyrosine transport system substrate-binding protein
MRRRDFIAALGGGALSPLSAFAQQPERLRRIGYLSAAAENDPEGKRHVDALVQGLHELKWIEGRNLHFEVRRATGGVITKDAAENLVRSQPDVLVAPSTVALKLLHQTTGTVPIVFIAVSDPVRDGVVTSFARPGGNITGFISTEPSMVDKWYELLKAIAPQVTKTLILFNPNTAPYPLYQDRLKAVALSFGLEAVPAPVQSPADIERTLSRAGENGGYNGAGA